MARLVTRGFARAIEPGPVRRGRLYNVHHQPLHEAIGQADNRNRRLRTLGRMVERVMILDAVVGDRRCWWLSPADDKCKLSCLKRDNYRARGLPAHRLRIWTPMNPSVTKMLETHFPERQSTTTPRPLTNSTYRASWAFAEPILPRASDL